MPRPTITSRLGTELAVTKTVRDTAAILDALQGAVPSDLFAAPLPEGSYLAEVERDPGRLRVGLITSVDHGAVDTHPESVRAASRAGELMESLGHFVEESGPKRLFDEEFLENAEIDYGCRMLANFEAIWRAIKREPLEGDVEPYTWARMERCRAIPGIELVRAGSWLQAYSNRIISWWIDFDLLLTPSTGEPPAKLEELEVGGSDPFDIDVKRFARIRCFVRPFNVTGQPAISLPLHMTSGGLPVGVQLVGAPYREDLLLRVAAQLQQAAPWSDRKPQL